MSLRTRLSSVLSPVALVLALLLIAVVPESAYAAQEALPGARVGAQNLRPYWHVFAAYAIVIALIGGWAFSIARRLRNLENRLVD